MERLTDSDVILSIETATCGGSLSILANSREIDGWGGTEEISKAEDILDQISKLLRKNDVEKKNIKLICVSSGAGSATGEKIGWAIAKGLARALKCRLLGVSILESMLIEIENEPDGEYVAALPVGKNYICRQRFVKREKSFHKISAVEVCSADEFFSLSKSSGFKKIVIAAGDRDDVRRFFSGASENSIIQVRKRLAELNGQAANHSKCV